MPTPLPCGRGRCVVVCNVFFSIVESQGNCTMPRDYYVILGVSRGASLEQIKHAYRKIAKRSHPDASRTPNAEEFIEIREAYETLADEDKRRSYDAGLSRRRIPISISGFPETVVQRHVALAEMDLYESALDEFFRGFVPGVFGKERFRSPTKDLHYEMLLTATEAKEGGLFPVRVPVAEPCPRCTKSGIWDGFLCPVCLGNGRLRSEREFFLSIPPNIQNGARQKVSLEDVGLRDVFLNVYVTIGTDQANRDW